MPEFEYSKWNGIIYKQNKLIHVSRNVSACFRRQALKWPSHSTCLGCHNLAVLVPAEEVVTPTLRTLVFDHHSACTSLIDHSILTTWTRTFHNNRTFCQPVYFSSISLMSYVWTVRSQEGRVFLWMISFCIICLHWVRFCRSSKCPQFVNCSGENVSHSLCFFTKLNHPKECDLLSFVFTTFPDFSGSECWQVNRNSCEARWASSGFQMDEDWQYPRHKRSVLLRFVQLNPTVSIYLSLRKAQICNSRIFTALAWMLHVDRCGQTW